MYVQFLHHSMQAGGYIYMYMYNTYHKWMIRWLLIRQLHDRDTHQGPATSLCNG